jgi:hypothetical protein
VPDYWFGSMPMIEAIAIAWALSFRGQQVRLMFVLPVTSKGLVIFVVAMSVLRVIAVAQAPEGLLSPFGGMAAGWFLGGGSPSPLRKLYLKFKLQSIEREVAREKQERAQRAARAPFDVIEGGRSKQAPGKERSSRPKNRGDKGPDGNLLN